MPLLSELINGITRLNTNVIRSNVRYCDSEDNRHQNSVNISCSYALPEITCLVPEEHRHKRIRDGIQSTHYSFNSIQNASLLLRLNKRFESIENDRQENIVDILNDLNNRSKESSTLLQKVVLQVDTEGTVCTLLKQLCDAFKASLISESPQMESLAINMGIVVDNTSNLVFETRGVNKELVAIGSTFKDVINICSKSVAENNHQMSDQMDKVLNEMSSLKTEIQLTNSSIERLEATNQMNGIDLKQDLLEIKHQMSQMNEEIRSMRDAIINILPEKMIQLLNITTVDSTQMASDIDVDSIDGNEESDQTTDEECVQQLESE